jgi:hypothetical protein
MWLLTYPWLNVWVVLLIVAVFVWLFQPARLPVPQAASRFGAHLQRLRQWLLEPTRLFIVLLIAVTIFFMFLGSLIMGLFRWGYM